MYFVDHNLNYRDVIFIEHEYGNPRGNYGSPYMYFIPKMDNKDYQLQRFTVVYIVFFCNAAYWPTQWWVFIG